MGEAQARLDEMSDLAERTRLDAEGTRAQAAKEAGRLTEDAHEAAAQIISEAKATAERIRSDSDRELAAATQRRDSINSQLANVRQMLATLTGTAPFSLTGLADAPDEAWVGADDEHASADGGRSPATSTRPRSQPESDQEVDASTTPRSARRSSPTAGPDPAGAGCRPARSSSCFPCEPAECRLVTCRSRPRPSSCSVPPATWHGASCSRDCSTSSRRA